jgi:D-xylose transport system ATP-binding protein
VLSTPLLQLHRVNKSFGAVQVLTDVTFTARAGHVTALVGDNGAGKSTLVKCIGGIYPMDSGTYLVDGAPVTVQTPGQAAGLGIDIVYQDQALCDNLDIVQNMFLGRELRRGIVLDEPTMERMAAATLRRLSAHTARSIRQPVYTLSGGQRQAVAIAKALLWNSRVVILDEPTAAAGVAQTARILELIRQLADDGLAVVLISHNMNDVFAVADSVATLYLGQMCAQLNASELTYPSLIELITTGTSRALGVVPPTPPPSYERNTVAHSGLAPR